MAETKAKAPAKKAAPAKAAAPKKVTKPAADGQVKVTQIGSPIGRTKDQAATLIGLGLGKRHRSRVLANTPEVQGMIRAVQHLITVEKA